jgi:hypothetical protein
MEDLSEKEKLVDQHIKENNKDLAVKLLYDLIVKNAEEKNFSRAEALREKLFEVDSLAINEIVKSAEVIEAEKMGTIDPDHLDMWSPLYDTLTKEEKIALYFGMKDATYEAEHIIFRQGELNSNLYFIVSGQLSMFYHKEKHGILERTPFFPTPPAPPL